MSGVAVLRPEPGATRTAERARALNLDVLLLPLFEARAVAWGPPDPSRFDGLLLTSAAAPRLAGPGLDALAMLPVVAVGVETAQAARAAGLSVAAIGEAGAAQAVALARSRGLHSLLHLAGRERMPDLGGVEPVVVYASEPLPVAPGATAALEGRVALLHSARAAARLAELVHRDGTRRDRMRLAALSPAVLAAAGPGWAEARAAATPTDAALLDLALGRND